MDCKFISIGDITSDAFIELQEASVNCNVSTDRCTITMGWGDKIPYRDVVVVPAVGNSPNASVSVSRLGIDVGLISFVGDDEHGKECIDLLEKEGVETKYMKKEVGKKTNYHYVLSYEAERTILVRHENFTYSLPENLNGVEWVYFSSVGESAEMFHDEISEWLDSNENTKLVFQPGTFQMNLGYERLKNIYKKTHLFICNKQEAQRILKSQETDIKLLLKEMHERGPKIVSITDGPNGAYLFDEETTFFVPQYPDIDTPKERTGAGDAYSSTLAAFLSKGYSLKDSLLRAPINSMSVVQHIGAQEGLLSESEIEKYLEKAPKEYFVSTL